MTEAEYRRRVAKALALSETQADEYMRDMWNWYCGELDVELMAFAECLRPAVATAILSNSASGAREQEEARYGFSRVFAPIVYSHEVGLLKPDREIYALTCGLLAVEPHEAVFLDDIGRNLKTARALGMATIVFQWILGDDGLVWYLPPFLFVIMVGAGADYAIYLIARIREEAEHRPTREAAERATAATGSVIASAGLILAGTFSALMAADLRPLVQMGFAIAAGILIDTLVVRTILGPAIATALGRVNWWPSSRGRNGVQRAAPRKARALRACRPLRGRRPSRRAFPPAAPLRTSSSARRGRRRARRLSSCRAPRSRACRPRAATSGRGPSAPRRRSFASRWWWRRSPPAARTSPTALLRCRR